jgi:hypothetical protein
VDVHADKISVCGSSNAHRRMCIVAQHADADTQRVSRLDFGRLGGDECCDVRC